MSGDIHSGHRTRMKQRYLGQGLEGFSDHEALELLLYYAIPRADVNPLAHRLLERFGSFRGVLDAEAAELTEVEGMGESAAALLRLVRDLNRRYLLDRQEKRPLLADSETAGRFLLPYFSGLREERVYVAFMDDELRLIRGRHRLRPPQRPQAGGDGPPGKGHRRHPGPQPPCRAGRPLHVGPGGHPSDPQRPGGGADPPAGPHHRGGGGIYLHGGMRPLPPLRQE